LTGYLRSRGYPLAEIARTLHVSDVSIRRWIKQAAERAERLAEEQAARAAKRGGRGTGHKAE
jgi:transposase-like protein